MNLTEMHWNKDEMDATLHNFSNAFYEMETVYLDSDFT